MAAPSLKILCVYLIMCTIFRLFLLLDSVYNSVTAADWSGATSLDSTLNK